MKSRSEEIGVLIQKLLENGNGKWVYNSGAGNYGTHIPVAKAASDSRGLLDHVRSGDEVVIEHDARSRAVVWSVVPAPCLHKAFAAVAP